MHIMNNLLYNDLDKAHISDLVLFQNDIFQQPQIRCMQRSAKTAVYKKMLPSIIIYIFCRPMQDNHSITKPWFSALSVSLTFITVDYI